MTFAWPYALALVLVVPLIVAVHLWLQRRRRRFAVSYASLALIREALPGRSRWRRRVPFALFLAALLSLAIAAARPQAVVAVPLSRTTIILALDVSGSMCSTDVPPNRLAVAEDTARTFIKEQAGGTRIGIVAFSGIAQLVVPPTTDRDALLAAIDGFSIGRGTAVGTAVLRAVDAVAEINPNVTRTGVDLAGPAGGGAATPGTPPAGGYQPDIVVLLTDGATTQGVNPLVAAQQAADRGVRVYTIGFGTTEPASMVCSREQVGTSLFGSRFAGGGQGGSFRGFGGGGAGGRRGAYLLLDEKTLQSIADITGATYHRAVDAKQLDTVFHDLPAQITLQREHVEVGFAFAALGALLATTAVGLSLLWNRYG